MEKQQLLTERELNELVEKIGEENARGIIDGSLALQIKKWKKQDGIIYTTVTSDGTSGLDWVTRLEKDGYNLTSKAKYVLASEECHYPTNGTVYNIAIIPGKEFPGNARTTKHILSMAADFGFTTPHMEVAPLLREKFSDTELEELGLWWILVMHEQPADLGFGWLLLNRYNSDHHLRTSHLDSGLRWNRDGSFAFIASQYTLESSSQS